MLANVDLWWAHLHSSGTHLLSYLPPAELTRFHRIPHAADQGRFLVGAALLRLSLSQKMSQKPADIPICRTCATCGENHGKPRLEATTSSSIHLSVSHSGMLILIAHSNIPVGVDVQKMLYTDEKGQQQHLTAIQAAQWCAREAQYKATGSFAKTVPTYALTPPKPGYAAALACRDPQPAIRVHDSTHLLQQP